MSAKLPIIVPAVCFFALFIVFDGVTGSLQKITFYEQPNCSATGKNVTIQDTDQNLWNTWVTNATSIRIIGVWHFYLRNTTSSGIISPIIFGNTNPPQGSCINKSEWPVTAWQNYTINSATRLGPPDMASSQLILYTERDFNLGRVHKIENASFELGSVEQIRSYIHFSNDTWTLFSGKGYTGTTTILRPSSANGRDDFVYKTYANIQVGSVKKGLHNAATTTTTSRTTTTTRKNGAEKRNAIGITIISISFILSSIVNFKLN